MTHLRNNPSILFALEDETLFVLDIPLSIAISQHLEQAGPTRQVLSSSPPEQPYPATEPKSEKAKANLLARIDASTRARSEEYAVFCRAALERFRQSYDGPWCALRILERLPNQKEDSRKKRTRSPDNKGKSTRPQRSLNSALILYDSPVPKFWEAVDFEGRLVCNNGSKAHTFLFEDHGGHSSISLPPCSSFHMDDISLYSVNCFERSILRLYPESSATAAPGQFDIILMDPPWQNRSALRREQYATFATSTIDQDNLLPIAMILPRILSPCGLLGIWITNKAASRERALEMFAMVGMSLISELIWLKITTNGVPTYPLEGLYRQPWEVCLIGKAQDDPACTPVKRLILACPERHSRKPFLGDILTALHGVKSTKALRKLEVFARCTASGWCAWGDEPFKFNNENYWQKVS